MAKSQLLFLTLQVVVVQEQVEGDMVASPTPATAQEQGTITPTPAATRGSGATPTPTSTQELLDTIQESISGSVGGVATQGSEEADIDTL